MQWRQMVLLWIVNTKLALSFTVRTKEAAPAAHAVHASHSTSPAWEGEEQKKMQNLISDVRACVSSRPKGATEAST